MADISVNCPKCGSEYTVSEYVAAPTLNCSACGFDIPLREPEEGLTVKKEAGQAGPPPPPPLPSEPEGPADNLPSAAVHNVGRAERKIVQVKENGTPAWVIQWGVFLLVGGLWVGLEWMGSRSGQYLEFYKMARLFLIPAVLLWTIVAAFQEATLQGVLCIFVPPYLLYYALGKCDVYPLRGAFFALVLGLGMEMKYFPQHAVITHAQVIAERVITGGQEMIVRPGSADLERL